MGKKYAAALLNDYDVSERTVYRYVFGRDELLTENWVLVVTTAKYFISKRWKSRNSFIKTPELVNRNAPVNWEQAQEKVVQFWKSKKNTVLLSMQSTIPQSQFQPQSRWKSRRNVWTNSEMDNQSYLTLTGWNVQGNRGYYSSDCETPPPLVKHAGAKKSTIATMGCYIRKRCEQCWSVGSGYGQSDRVFGSFEEKLETFHSSQSWVCFKRCFLAWWS